MTARTPPPGTMVNTRNNLRKMVHSKLQDVDDHAVPQDPPETPITSQASGTRDEPLKKEPEIRTEHTINNKTILVHSESEFKTDHNIVQRPSSCHSNKNKSTTKSKSTSSSIIARRKQLELEAAQVKARIQMELIDKKLAADLAALEEDKSYSSQSESVLSKQDVSDIERWVDQSQMELRNQRVCNKENTEDTLKQPVKVTSGTDGSALQLAAAIQQLVTSTVTNNENKNLISRISTPRDLPIFSGDAMEWLQFQQAYEESTELCKFNDKENVWRLRRCLRGPAREAVSSLLITPTTPDKIMETLKLLFGNPDIILCKILNDLKRLSPLPLEYHKEITKFSIKVSNFVTAVRALGRDDYLQGENVATIILSKLPTMLLSKWTDYSYTVEGKEIKSRLCILSDFLHEEAVKLSQSGANLLYIRHEKKHYSAHNETVLLQNRQSNSDEAVSCRFCKKSAHNLVECKKFKKALRKDRWQYVKRNGLCYKCLLSRHDRITCPAPACDINNCGKNHHQLLHYVPRHNLSSAVPEPELNFESPPLTETVNHINTNICAVLLKVVPINIQCAHGVIKTIALLDDGSTVSLIATELAERAGLRGKRECLRVRGAWDNNELVCESQLVNMTISNKYGENFNLKARSVNELNLPRQNSSMIDCNKYKHLNKIKSELCVGQLKPEILIGQDNYHLILPLESVIGSPDEPCATRTPLGWCLHGRVNLSAVSHHSTFFITDQGEQQDLAQLQEDVRRFFTIESMGVSGKPRENGDDVRAKMILEESARLINQQWYVNLPWKDDNCTMPDSYPTAVRRMKGVEKKMKFDAEYAQRYRDRIKHLFDNNYAEELSEDGCGEKNKKIWYLPHFGVDNPNKKKLRLVFDAAAKINGLSLNDYLLKGPDLLQSLFGIMLRFRENRVAMTADIKDMFLRVKINPKDRNVFRFLFPDEQGCLKQYVMSSLIFGANCSPFVAQFVKNKNTERFSKQMPRAREAIVTSHYMDDYIDSVPDEETALKLLNEVTYIHKQGNFYIRNWTTNNSVILNAIPKEDLGDVAVRFKIGQLHADDGERTLGLIWEPCKDILKFDISLKRIPENLIIGTQNPTKRQMLKIIMSIFDVFGLLAPITITGKIILQDCWQESIGWDECIPYHLQNRWHKWINVLASLRNVYFPRHYEAACRGENGTEHASSEGVSYVAITKPVSYDCAFAPPPPPSDSDNYTNLQLHTFCDASNKAMCAVAYWRWINKKNNKVCVAFVASRCRVAPLKTTTIPRLELQASVLAARLTEIILNEHRMKPQQRYFWSDSTTVLYWIKNNKRCYKTFIAHRLGEIDELTNQSEWRYVPSKLNIADIATRENFEDSALRGEWMYGPGFLYSMEDMWPMNVIQMEKDENLVGSGTLKLLSSFVIIVIHSNKFLTTSLQVILRERTPREETFLTFLAEVENMVNSRPLTHVSVDPKSLETLTPNHFLIGSSSNMPQLGIFDDSDACLRKQWRISQALADMYWKRWVREVLPEMTPRKKWLSEQRPLEKGDLVLISDQSSPRNIWPKGLVQEVLPAKDGRVRMIRVKTQTGTLTRSVTRVIRIPVGTECC